MLQLQRQLQAHGEGCAFCNETKTNTDGSKCEVSSLVDEVCLYVSHRETAASITEPGFLHRWLLELLQMTSHSSSSSSGWEVAAWLLWVLCEWLNIFVSR